MDDIGIDGDGGVVEEASNGKRTRLVSRMKEGYMF